MHKVLDNKVAVGLFNVNLLAKNERRNEGFFYLFFNGIVCVKEGSWFDSSDPFGYKKFMRFRVDLDISKPLMRGMKILVGGVQKWIDFRYVKLPDFCYLCGLFGHSAKNCALYDDEIPESMYPYGSWLRASPTRIRFPGEYVKNVEMKLLEDFKSNFTNPKAKQKINFDNAVEWEEGLGFSNTGRDGGSSGCNKSHRDGGRRNKRGRNDEVELNKDKNMAEIPSEATGDTNMKPVGGNDAGEMMDLHN